MEPAKKMIAWADEKGLPADRDIRTRAEAFEEATRGFYAEPQECDVR